MIEDDIEKKIILILVTLEVIRAQLASTTFTGYVSYTDILNKTKYLSFWP